MLLELIDELRNMQISMAGGVEAAPRWCAGCPGTSPWDLYVGRSLLDRYGDRPGLRRVTETVNVVLHFVDDDTRCCEGNPPMRPR